VGVLEPDLHARGGDPEAGRLSELDRVPALLERFAPSLFSESTTWSQATLAMHNALGTTASSDERRGEKHLQSRPTVHVLSSEDDSTTTLTAGSADTRSKIDRSSAHML
jgi:hypothetical protein